jgi:hypothetical protein
VPACVYEDVSVSRPENISYGGEQLLTRPEWNKRRLWGVLITILALASIDAWLFESRASATIPGEVWLMPSAYASGGNVTDFGVHYDDSAGGAAYDYSPAGDNNAWLRGELIGNSNTFRYMYWNQSACRVRARMQVWDTGTSSWLNIYDYDVDILHLDHMPTSTQYTQTFAANGDWFYKVVGLVGDACGTDRAHSHLEVTPSSVVTISSKSNNTCWEDGSYCAIGTVRKDAGTTCPPSTYSGTDAHKSGPVTTYRCEEWSSQSFSDGTSAFVFS